MYADRFTADITDTFSDFIYNRLKNAQGLTKKLQDDIQLTVTTNPKHFDGFHRIIDSKVSRPCHLHKTNVSMFR